MCENKGIKKDHSANLHATANNKGNKYGGKNMPSWQNFTAKCPKREGGVFLLLSSVLTGWSHFLTLTANTASFGEGTAECCPIHSQLREIVVGAPCTPLPFPPQLNQRSKCMAHAEENNTTGW